MSFWFLFSFSFFFFSFQHWWQNFHYIIGLPCHHYDAEIEILSIYSSLSLLSWQIAQYFVRCGDFCVLVKIGLILLALKAQDDYWWMDIYYEFLIFFQLEHHALISIDWGCYIRLKYPAMMHHLSQPNCLAWCVLKAFTIRFPCTGAGSKIYPLILWISRDFKLVIASYTRSPPAVFAHTAEQQHDHFIYIYKGILITQYLPLRVHGIYSHGCRITLSHSPAIHGHFRILWNKYFRYLPEFCVKGSSFEAFGYFLSFPFSHIKYLATKVSVQSSVTFL